MKQYIEPNTAIQQIELHTFICSGDGPKKEGGAATTDAQAAKRVGGLYI